MKWLSQLKSGNFTGNFKDLVRRNAIGIVISSITLLIPCGVALLIYSKNPARQTDHSATTTAQTAPTISPESAQLANTQGGLRTGSTTSLDTITPQAATAQQTSSANGKPAPSDRSIASPAGTANNPSAIGSAGIAAAAKETPAKETSIATPLTCLTLNFTHVKTQNHSGSQRCNHRNSIKLDGKQSPELAQVLKNLDPKSVCVKADGTPVEFQRSSGADKVLDRILIGAVAGPESTISIRLCPKSIQAKCADDCKIPRDEFMEAIGGGEQEDAADSADKSPDLAGATKTQPARAPAQAWDPNTQDTDSEDVAALEDEFRHASAKNNELSLFDGWSAGSPTPACGLTASNNVPSKNVRDSRRNQ